MRNIKIGLSPGSLVYTGNIKNKKVKVISLSYNSDDIHVLEHDSYRSSTQLKDNDYTHWINVIGLHNIETIEKIGKIYIIDNLILEDILNINQRPKYEERENFIFLVLKMALFNETNGNIKYNQISFILGEHFLLTFQEIENHVFDEIINKLKANLGKLRKRKENYLNYILLDLIIDNYFIIFEYFEEKLNVLEEKIISAHSKLEIESIVNLKKDIVAFRKNIYPLQEVVSKIVRDEHFDDINVFIKDLQDHSIMIYENTEALYNRSIELIQLYHSTLGNTMNETMKILTIISTIFIPLSFITGLYGMNFHYMPILSLKYGYYLIVGIMCLLFIIMVIYFKIKKWW
ncbi:magnesium/cobalt transporter CorA [Fusobacterium sp. PH5-44]|uniref:magnesium/cobalt transporter CorA n=1 Tax=unclassified Fusobacterium TaxID=2648384 RepID=UPI003D260F4B